MRLNPYSVGIEYAPDQNKNINLRYDDQGNVTLRGEARFADGGRIGFEKGTIPRMLKFLIDKLADEKDFNRKLLERSNPKAVQDLYIEKYGKLPSAEEIKDIVNKQLQNKGSMEVTNPKTGEVTTPKNPIMTVEDLQFKHKDAFNAHDQINIDIGDKIAPDMIAESMAEMKGKEYFSLSQKEQSDLYKKALAYVDDVRMTKRQNKSLYVKGDAITEENFGNTPFAPDLSGLEEARRMTKGMNLQDEMNKVLNQYDKSMFVKNEQGMVDVANPENVRKMALLLQRDHPELYKKLEGETKTETPVIKNRALDSFLKVLNTDRSELERIQQKYTGVIDDSFLKAILLDPNPQSRAEVMAKIDEALIMQQKGMSGEEIIDILDKTKRTKQAQGGPIGLNYLMGF